jgi:ribosomal protein S18 acetylase RimI-like enzyme
MDPGARLEAPASLAAAGISLRPVVAADRAFLERLYRLVRWDEFAPTGWPDAAKIAFLAQQFEFQRRHYAQAHDGAEYHVIVQGAEPIGRIYVDRTGRDLALIEISLLPQWRGRGIGAALLGRLQQEVEAGLRDRVSLQVAPDNPARRLYARMGFVETAPASEFQEASIEMVWPASALATEAS